MKDMPLNSSELGGLRTVLRERADLAPDATTILGRTHTLVRRRRARRRTAGLLGAVLVTIGGLSTAALLTHDNGPNMVAVGAPEVHAVAPAVNPVIPPTMPFTVGAVPAGYSVDTWTVSPTGPDTVQLAGKNDFQTIVVSWSDSDPALQESQVSQTTVHGHAAVIGSIPQQPSMRRISWPVPGGHWLGVIGNVPVVGEQNLRLVAGSITLRPSVMPVNLHLKPVPAAIANVAEWNGGNMPPALDEAVLCQAGVTDPNSKGCVSVQLSTGTRPTSVLGPFKPGNLRGPLPSVALHVVTVQGMTLYVTDRTGMATGGVVVRQIDAGHWVSVTSAGADLDTLYRVAIAAGLS